MAARFRDRTVFALDPLERNAAEIRMRAKQIARRKQDRNLHAVLGGLSNESRKVWLKTTSGVRGTGMVRKEAQVWWYGEERGTGMVLW